MVVKHVCVVCGRKFPEGQGITLNFGGEVMRFHSKACAIKFIRRFLEELDPGASSSVARKVADAFAEELKVREEARKKKLI